MVLLALLYWGWVSVDFRCGQAVFILITKGTCMWVLGVVKQCLCSSVVTHYWGWHVQCGVAHQCWVAHLWGVACQRGGTVWGVPHELGVVSVGVAHKWGVAYQPCGKSLRGFGFGPDLVDEQWVCHLLGGCDLNDKYHLHLQREIFSKEKLTPHCVKLVK